MVSASEKSTYGRSSIAWENAKVEATLALRRIARNKDVITYGVLVGKIDSVQFEPHGHDFHDFLGQVSIDENEAGRGMLSALVVHQDGDRMPGIGFFELAAYLGRPAADKVIFWSEEVKRVYEANRR
jgi:hypothetical protein